MRRILILVLGGLAASSASTGLQAQDVKAIGGMERAGNDPNRKVHRREVAKRDADGWLTAHATEGGFTVRLPLPFNDITQTHPAPASTIVTGIESIRGKPEAFTAFRQARREADVKLADGYLDQLAKSIETSGKIVSNKRSKVGDQELMDIEVLVDDSITVNYHFVITPTDSILLTTFCLPDSKLTKADKQKFFDSLKIDPLKADK